MTEVGKKFDQGKLQYDLVPFECMDELAKNHIGTSVGRYCQGTDRHEYGVNIAGAIRAKMEEER